MSLAYVQTHTHTHTHTHLLRPQKLEDQSWARVSMPSTSNYMYVVHPKCNVKQELKKVRHGTNQTSV